MLHNHIMKISNTDICMLPSKNDQEGQKFKLSLTSTKYSVINCLIIILVIIILFNN